MTTTTTLIPEQAYHGAWKDISLPRLLTFSPHVVGSPDWPPVNHHTSRELAEQACEGTDRCGHAD